MNKAERLIDGAARATEKLIEGAAREQELFGDEILERYADAQNAAIREAASKADLASALAFISKWWSRRNSTGVSVYLFDRLLTEWRMVHPQEDGMTKSPEFVDPEADTRPHPIVRRGPEVAPAQALPEQPESGDREVPKGASALIITDNGESIHLKLVLPQGVEIGDDDIPLSASVAISAMHHIVGISKGSDGKG